MGSVLSGLITTSRVWSLSFFAAMTIAVAAGSTAHAMAPAGDTPDTMYMVCSAIKPGGTTTRYWSAYFAVREPGHDMKAWKNQPGNYGVFNYGDNDLMGQWVKYSESQGLTHSDCGISGTLASIMGSINSSRSAQPQTVQDDTLHAKWRPAPMNGKSFLVGTYDRNGARID